MAKVICKDYELEKKCGCGFRFTRLYAFEGDDKNFDDVGLCGMCLAELLEEFGYEVLKPDQAEVKQ